MRQFAFDTIQRRGIPALMVTHDPADAAAAGGSVTELSQL
jgi:putative thiamine transport system ATP-binding protein